MFESQAVVGGISGLDLGINGSECHVGQHLGSGPGAELSKIVGADRDVFLVVVARRKGEHGVVGRVLDDVECYVIEVPLEANAVATTNAGLAVADGIPREADFRSKLCFIQIPKATVGRGLTSHQLAGSNPVHV